MGYSVKQIRKQFAEQGVFYTDDKLARLIADAVSTGGDVVDVYDPTCGAGNLLAVFPDDVAKYGQEIDAVQAEVARQRLPNAHIVTGDTLLNPAFTERKFRHIVANYPFSIKWQPFSDPRWDAAPTLPPPSKADYAFILHIVSMLADDGVAAMLGSPGILYRGAREGKIREWLVRENLIESVTHIEGGHFEDTSIPTALIVFRKGKTTTDVVFRDHERGLEATASLKDIEANGFNLSPQGYIVVGEKRPEPDLVALEMSARSLALRNLEAQINYSKGAIEIHSTFGLPPLPPLADFLRDIRAVADKYR